MDLVEAVLKLAVQPGYLVIGHPETVWRRRARRSAETDRAAPDEELAVIQLLRNGLLTLGGYHQITHGRHDIRARAVLVLDSTRNLTRRLAAYQRPASWRTPT